MNYSAGKKMCPHLRPAALLLLVVAACCGAFARQTKTVVAEYLYQIPADVSAEQAKSIALDRAKIQAIADEFGTTVTQANTTSMTVDNGAVSSRFESIGGSELKGEWLETIGEPSYEFLADGSNLAVRVVVKGKIRELNANRVPVNISTFRNGLTPADESRDFMAGDALYMSFRASSNGYLAIYLIDANDDVFCLLPYSGQSGGIFATRADKPHFLFSRAYTEDVDRDLIDELIMDTDRENEHNRILAVFSPNKFYKAVDSKEEADLPRVLNYQDFYKWLGEIRKRDADLSVHEIAITIHKSL